MENPVFGRVLTLKLRLQRKLFNLFYTDEKRTSKSEQTHAVYEFKVFKRFMASIGGEATSSSSILSLPADINSPVCCK